jgi:hypothetical protein
VRRHDIKALLYDYTIIQSQYQRKTADFGWLKANFPFLWQLFNPERVQFGKLRFK